MSEQPASEQPPKRKGAEKKVAKKKVSAADSNAILKLHWDLHELPSSQHRAGLAGLALCLGFLKRKPDRKGVCEIERIDEGTLTFAVDRAGMQSRAQRREDWQDKD
jgi:hypothetical protein